jgi:acetolactate synthase-1/2/3 large subunit
MQAPFGRLRGTGLELVPVPAKRTPPQAGLAADKTVVIDVKADKDCPTPVYDFAAGARAWSYHE